MWPHKTTSLKVHANLGVELSGVYHYPGKFGNLRHCDSEDMLLVCHVTSRDCMLRIYGWKPLMGSHHFANFVGHWSEIRIGLK